MKQHLIYILTIVLFTSGYHLLNAQVSEDSEIFKALKAHDSLLFEVSFNQCDLSAINGILADDLEFYHDISGVTNSKQEFMDIMENGICKEGNAVTSRRELVEGQLKVYPLYKNGTLYGALQTGEHRFFERLNNGPERDGSIAKFSHLWLKRKDHWVLKRVISYDHHMPKVEK